VRDKNTKSKKRRRSNAAGGDTFRGGETSYQEEEQRPARWKSVRKKRRIFQRLAGGKRKVLYKSVKTRLGSEKQRHTEAVGGEQ